MIKKCYLLSIFFSSLFLFTWFTGISQVNRQVYWTKNYGGSSYDIPNRVKATPDGGWIFCGTTSSNDFDVSGLHGTDGDIWVVKVDSIGVIQWQKTYLTAATEKHRNFIRTSDGGYAICCGVWDVGRFRTLILKINSAGTLEWQKLLISTSAEAYTIAETIDGGLALTGASSGIPNGEFVGQPYHSAESDLFVAKLSSNGTFLWGRVFGGQLGDHGEMIMQLNDGNLLIGGFAVSTEGDVVGNHGGGNGDVWVLKLTQQGTLIWKKCYGGTGSDAVFGGFEKNNRYHLIGQTRNSSNSPSGDVTGMIDGQDIWYVVLDTAGNLVRQKCIGGTGNFDAGVTIAPTLDSNIIITGISNSNDMYVSGNHGYMDLALIKIDSLGNKIWGKLFGSSAYDVGQDVIVNSDSSFTVLGQAQGSGGDVSALYGAGDIWMLHYVDTSLYQDLYTKLSTSPNFFRGNKINYTLTFGKNNKTVSADTVVLQFVKDSILQLVSITRPPSLVSGDTLIWKIPKAAVVRSDSILLAFRINPVLTFMPDSVRVKALIGPYTTEYYQTNNVVYSPSKIKNQNAAITNINIDITSTAFISTGKPESYTIPYSFQNQLDSLTGILKLVKDHKTQFINATPLYNSFIGDTLIWNFTVTPGLFTRNIFVTLQADSPIVQLGDSIKNFVTLQFNTLDTGVLKKTDSLRQLVNRICQAPDLTNTTLPYPQGIQWLRVSGGSAVDIGTDIAATSDTTFVTTAATSSHDGDAAGGPPNDNALVTKYLTNGNIVWQKLLGGAGDDGLYSLVKTDGGSVIVAGETSSIDGTFSGNHGSGDVWLTKLDSNGNTIWQKTLGGSGHDGDRVYIRKFRDNRYLVLASTSSNNGDVINPFPTPDLNPWLFMIDENGSMIWQKVFSDTLFTYLNDLQVTPDNGILIAGEKDGFSPSYYYEIARLVKTDSLGNILFLKTYKNAGRNQRLASVAVNADSTLMLAGTSWSSAPSGDQYCYGDHLLTDIWLAKTDKIGAVQWEKYYGGSRDEYPLQIIKSKDEGFLICGNSSSNNGNVTGNHDNGVYSSDAWLIKIHDNGTLAWQKMIGGDDYDGADRMIQISNSEIIVTGASYSYNNGDIYGSRGEDDALLFKIGVSNSITGMVYVDHNGNHIKENNEPLLEQGIVKSTKGNLTNSSNIINGFFATGVDTGSYVSQPVINNPYFLSFPVSGTSAFNSYANIDTINFAMVPVAAINDLKITVLPISAVRPGFETQYIIKYENIGTTTITNGNITFIKDHRTSVVSATLPYTSMIADTIKWDFANFAPFETNEFILKVQLDAPPLLIFGDTLHIEGVINPLADDSTIVDNVSRVNQLVTGSFDSNDKTETHGPGFPSQLLAKGESLNYIIRFQNTGTDTAFRVLIKDTLDNNLDWNSLQMVSASHDYHLTVTNGNVLEWKFDPIILPDSNHNEVASHGFIAYSIKPKQDLLAGDTIANRAGIYFDFNLPVLTNTQHTVIDNGVNTCPGGSKVYASGVRGALSYKWQVNDGTGYVDLVNSGLYTGVNSDSLWIIAPPTSTTGNKYRCIVTTAEGNVTGIEYQLKIGVTWTGAVSTAWEDPGNWDCGVIPDSNTDVLIKSGTIIVNSNREIRSITVKPGVQLWVNAGVVFSVLH